MTAIRKSARAFVTIFRGVTIFATTTLGFLWLLMSPAPLRHGSNQRIAHADAAGCGGGIGGGDSVDSGGGAGCGCGCAGDGCGSDGGCGACGCGGGDGGCGDAGSGAE